MNGENGPTTVADRSSNGRFTAGNRAAVRKAKSDRAPGVDGVVGTAGYIQTGEADRALLGRQKWVTYSNAYSRPPVAVALRLRSALLRGVKWTLRENPSGGNAAKRGLEIVQQGLLDARLPKPWSAIASKAGNGAYFHGASIHAWAMGRRKDGQVVFTDIAHRPMHTIEKWFRRGTTSASGKRTEDPTAPFASVEQRTQNGFITEIPLEQCLYLVNNDLGDGPEGVGVLRLVVDRIRTLNGYEKLEGTELFSTMSGTPIIRVPLEDIVNSPSIKKLPEEQRAAAIAARTQFLRDAVANRIKTPEILQYIELDSATYQGVDPNTISTIRKWEVEIVKDELQGVPHARKVITEDDLNIARILGVEWVFIGGNGTSGTYGMHESKVGVFAADLQTTADDAGIAGTLQLCRPLVAANGLDPDEATPDLVPEKITIGAILEAAQVLALESSSAPHPEDEAWDVLRERLELPKRPKQALIADMMAPRRSPVPPEDNPDEVEETPPEQEPPVGEKPDESALAKKRKNRRAR